MSFNSASYREFFTLSALQLTFLSRKSAKRIKQIDNLQMFHIENTFTNFYVYTSKNVFQPI